MSLNTDGEFASDLWRRGISTLARSSLGASGAASWAKVTSEARLSVGAQPRREAQPRHRPELQERVAVRGDVRHATGARGVQRIVEVDEAGVGESAHCEVADRVGARGEVGDIGARRVEVGSVIASLRFLP